MVCFDESKFIQKARRHEIRTLVRGLLLVSFVLSGSGCLEALQRHNTEARAKRRHDTIDTACRSRDADGLKEVLRKESNPENHKLAKRCYVDIKVADLLATDCPAFHNAYTERASTQEGSVTVTRKNPLIDFDFQGLSKEEVHERLVAMAQKARGCNDTHILFGAGGAGFDAAVLREIDEGHQLYPLLIGYLKQSAKHRPSVPDSYLIVNWLRSTQTAAQCAELEAVTRSDVLTPIRADILYFFARHRCKPQVRAVAGELLASPIARHRIDACYALRDTGDQTHAAKMRRLAQTDTARSIEEAQKGFWTYAYITYPVREACQSALNELELKDAQH